MTTKEPGFDFWGGEIVRLLEDHPNDDLKAGDAGYVWGVYNTSPPFYEADFYREDGTSIARPFTADEVEIVADMTSVRIPDYVHQFWRREAERQNRTMG